ncbi:glycoside hydrolase family 28 protein [Enterobacteriaceae endosymbiont of Donacia provostii]|uniref:glycoside hydrolase family 28 protein n=1 Tax=Enterobacteriaceae endosymbiont of Donacia provostii TaxID=2675781 RepID=UPI00144A25B0|nr:glycoside hydrolase family 28 protein [Enterobacteriaceae endosymbiont of Donacia provostii]QJC33691.1 glycoside hydrolase family 28 protein [Enterobacteriaceae endosymbiont of Donacia provostii]
MYNFKKKESILDQIKVPSFNQKKYFVKEYIKSYHKKKDDISYAINNTINDCYNNGGGIVVIPNGEFYTGPITLKSNVNLYLQHNTILKFYTDPYKYYNVFTRWEGTECINYTSLIYAYNQKNIAITGTGTLDGQANFNNWWSWKNDINGNHLQNNDVKKLKDMNKNNIPIKNRVFGIDHFLRPNFIQLYLCKNIFISDINIINSPMWEIHPVLSQNIIIQNIKINSLGPNNDGCNPESCNNVLIQNSVFYTGDDCIAIKSGTNNDGRKINIPSKNIIIKKCNMYNGHGAITLGSECSGGIKNIFIEDCIIDGKLQSFFKIKNNAIRGGKINNIYINNINIAFIQKFFLNIDYLYDEGNKGNFIPIADNIFISNINVENCLQVFNINSIEKSIVNNIFLKNCLFKGLKNPEKILIYNNYNINIINTKFIS